jgi:ribokinase
MAHTCVLVGLAAVAGRVVVVGSVNVDLVVRVERLPGPGETVSGGSFARHGGGKGANQAVAAARAGARTALVGRVGADADGDAARAELAALGVDVADVARDGAAHTGVALIAVDAEGRNQIAVAPGANRAIGPFPAGLLDAGPGCVLLSFDAPDPVLAEAAQAARAAGWEVVCNPAPQRDLPPALLAAQPVLVPNEHEAAALAGTDDPEAAARILAGRSGAPVVVTLGAAGALVVADGAALRVPAPVVDVVDTTGAGDALCGTLAAGLAAGLALDAAVRDAVAAASLSTTRAGAR